MTQHFTLKNLGFAPERLELQFKFALKWFEDNYIKIKSDKCQPFMSVKKYVR